MPLTLADYAILYPPMPPYGRWQRLLCRFGIHQGHRAWHEWDEKTSMRGMMRRFMAPIDLYGMPIQKIPFNQMDGKTYTYETKDATP
jgi:hypothetical protein